MKILLKNLGLLPYSLDIGDWDVGAMVRPLLASRDQPGDTIDIGGRVSPWDLNVQLYVRRLVVPDGSTRIVTPVAGGYSVTAVPPGQLKVTFLEVPNDLVFLFFGGGVDDKKVKVSTLDTTPDFLGAKLVAGAGIALTLLSPGGDEKVEISATGASSGGGSLIFGADAVGATTTTRYLYAGYAERLAEIDPHFWTMPRAGTLQKLYVRHDDPDGNGSTIVYRVRKNTVATLLLVSLASTATVASDLINTVPVAAGDIIDLQVVKTVNVGASPRNVKATMEVA